jgi:hypothetical protein
MLSRAFKVILMNIVKINMKLLYILLLTTFAWQSCYTGNDPKNPKKMENSDQKNNPAYSRTDSSKLILTDEEWKKDFRPRYII